jgi:hypothetical protein
MPPIPLIPTERSDGRIRQEIPIILVIHMPRCRRHRPSSLPIRRNVGTQ